MIVHSPSCLLFRLHLDLREQVSEGEREEWREIDRKRVKERSRKMKTVVSKDFKQRLRRDNDDDPILIVGLKSGKDLLHLTHLLISHISY